MPNNCHKYKIMLYKKTHRKTTKKFYRIIIKSLNNSPDYVFDKYYNRITKILARKMKIENYLGNFFNCFGIPFKKEVYNNKNSYAIEFNWKNANHKIQVENGRIVYAW